MAMHHGAVGNGEIFAADPLFSAFRAGFYGDAVVAYIDMTVANADVFTRLWIDAVCIWRVRRVFNFKGINGNILT